MIKSELTSALVESDVAINRKHAELVVQVVFDEIERALIAGKRVELRGFGTLSVRSRGARVGRNPKSGQQVQVAAKSVPFFRAGKRLRDRVEKSDPQSD